MTLSKAQKECIWRVFEKSLIKVADLYKKIREKNKELYEYHFSESDFISWVYYFLAKNLKKCIKANPEILSLTVGFNYDSSPKNYRKKIDFVVMEKRGGNPFIFAEFKYKKSGGRNLSNLHTIYENDFLKLKKQKEYCKKCFVFFHNPNDLKHKKSVETGKREQIEKLKGNLKNKKYKNFYLFYATPSYHILEKLK